MEDDLITGALLSDGTTIRADNFISNTTPANTYRMTDSNLIRPVTRKRMDSMDNYGFFFHPEYCISKKTAFPI